MMMQTKEQLLAHYARLDKPTSFIQYDVFYLGKNAGDDVLTPDKDGFAICGSSTQELMSGTTNVRILIRPNFEKRKVLKSLEKVKELLLKDAEYVVYANKLIEEESKYRKLHNDFKSLQKILAENNFNLQDAMAALNFGVKEQEPEDPFSDNLFL